MLREAVNVNGNEQERERRALGRIARSDDGRVLLGLLDSSAIHTALYAAQIDGDTPILRGETRQLMTLADLLRESARD